MKMKIQDYLKTKYVFLFLGIIILVFIILVSYNQSPDTEGNTINTIQTPEDDFEKEFKDTIWKSHMQYVERVGNTDFTAFVLNDLQNACPYYEPDGATYRDCLLRYVDEKKQTTKASAGLIKEFEDYCLGITKEYLGIESHNLYLSCVAYKLQ